MTLVKGKREHITILDFSGDKVSKNKIKQCLRNITFKDIYYQDNTLTIFDNHIKIGMYDVKLILQEDYVTHKYLKKLKEYGNFQVSISELDKEKKFKEVNIIKDKRFKDQYWAKKNRKEYLRSNNLVDVIFYCFRLNKLSAFW